jgi:Pvc16 N-terminal domain
VETVSNSLSVAMVTAALRRILAEALAAVPAGGVENVRVTSLRPDMLTGPEADAAGVNVFLFQVAANASWGGNSLPTRRPDGSVVARPEQALDLHYLLTFSGDENALEPQRLLGVAVTTLVAQPVLSRERVRDIVAKAVAADPATWEQYVDLADQIDVVRFSPYPLSIDDLSKLWTTFVQAPYRLSVTYQASVVLLDAEVSPQPALPVRTRGIDTAALNIPAITRVVADADPGDPLVPGVVMRVEGERLRGTYVTRLRVDGVEVPVPAGSVTGTALRVALPSDIPAGVHSLQVTHPRLIGTPAVERSGAESNAAALLVRPAVTGPVTAVPDALTGIDVTVPVVPPVGRQQRVVLLLNEFGAPDGRPARAYSFVAPPPAAAAPDTAVSVAIPTVGVLPGTYLVRLQVDGAQSVLAAGADGRYATPRLVVL